MENIVYEDGMGLSAWVNKKRVLIGNRALMQHYGVDTPSKDFEAKYCRDHRDILYLANSGELSAMFVLGYSINEEAAEMLRNLIDQNITIAVSVNDPNVTAEKICRLYEFPMEDIRIVPAQTQEALVMYCQPRERARAEAAHIGAAPSMVHAVCGADLLCVHRLLRHHYAGPAGHIPCHMGVPRRGDSPPAENLRSGLRPPTLKMKG